jgi:hypothetical protein
MSTLPITHVEGEMSDTLGYGWDDHADEGITELRRMLNSAIFAPLSVVSQGGYVILLFL